MVKFIHFCVLSQKHIFVQQLNLLKKSGMEYKQ